ncbi:class I SAM-dependent RNA methyltransferase [Deinococcus aquiradiocola]|uniref:class I SAM-dependent RNA methyltransferase n=1 Tax=Deinococcus aquiradiocola TaxID=393059 RepID=UPI00357163AF
MPSVSMELSIEKIVAGGLGLARTDAGVVLVRGALPGETVRADVRPGKGVNQGVTREVLTRSPDRVDAPNLPTTDLAHASYDAQLRYKREFVQEAMSRIAKLGEEQVQAVAPTVPSPREWAYRNTAQYLVTPEGLAYRERRSNAALSVERDPLIMENIQTIIRLLDVSKLEGVQELSLRGSRLTGEVVATLIAPGEPRAYLRAADELMDCGVVGVSLAAPAGRRFSAGVQLVAGESEIMEQYGNVKVSVSASGFAQINPEAAGLAYIAAARLAGNGPHAVDLYGGSGAIGRHLAPNFGRVVVLDTDFDALARGRHDVRLAGERNLTFRDGDAAQLYHSSLQAGVIVVDPPRVGLSEMARDALHDSSALKVVYVSCDPATWARDVGDLVKRGWTLGQVTPHDFYPQTSHVEVVSVLTRTELPERAVPEDAVDTTAPTEQ